MRVANIFWINHKAPAKQNQTFVTPSLYTPENLKLQTVGYKFPR